MQLARATAEFAGILGKYGGNFAQSFSRFVINALE
jgi:hypothetical protein